MRGEQVMEALGGVSDRYLLETVARLEGPMEKRPRRLRWQTVLLAAVLAGLLTACGWAVYQSYMRAHVPAAGEELRYTNTWMMADPSVNTLEFPNAAMIVRIEDTPAESGDALCRVNWLPEGLTEAPEYDNSFYSALQFYASHERYPGWDYPSVEEQLNMAGMSAEEAESWSYGVFAMSGKGKIRNMLEVAVYDGADLHGMDFLLGAYGGEATVMGQDRRGDWESLEIQVDYSSFYESLGQEPPLGERRKNYLFLYDAQRQLLLFVAGTDPAFSFEALQQVADQVEIKVTSYPSRSTDELLQNYILADLTLG